MKRVERTYRGWNPVAALVIDVGLIGETEARRRVLELYRPGTTVRALGSDRWLVNLPEPRELDAGRAPGAVLVERDGGLIGSPELTATEGEVAAWRGGAVVRDRFMTVAALDPSDWLELGDLPHAVLRPLALEPPPPIEAPALPSPDLRSVAHVRARSAESQAIEEAFGAAAREARRRRLPGRGGQSTGGDSGFGVLQAIGSALATLVLRTPAASALRRRELAYLERLSRQFQGDLDEALRNAIPLGGIGGAAVTLRLPGRRSSLEIGRFGIRRSTVAFGPNAYVHLTNLYRAAVARLEEDGRIEEAAFALVELLSRPIEGVDLLERHGRYELAARIAEDRQLDPAITIRLWWRAGDRRRAVALARRHHRFAAVLERLESIDPSEARDLRLEWVDWLEQSGDLLGAIEAGWPDPHVRPLLGGIAIRGTPLGGPAGAAMLAYRIALRPSEEASGEVRSFLASVGPDDGPSLRAFAAALVATDPAGALHREVATRTLRAVARVGFAPTDGSFVRAYRKVRERSDPVLAADLPRFAGPTVGDQVLASPLLPPGSIEVFDAVALPGGRMLVALGEAGCRLITSDGRTVTHWDVATHHIVAADHAGAALLIANRAPSLDVVRLDLATRRTKRYGAVSGGLWADTFDGSTWQVVDDRGIAFHDTVAARPTIVWRELEAEWRCLAIARDERSLSALVAIPSDRIQPGRVERWRWRVDPQTLATRVRVALPDSVTSVRLLADSGLIGLGPDQAPTILSAGPPRPFDPALPGQEVLASQMWIGVIDVNDVGEPATHALRILEQLTNPVLRARIALDDPAVGFRAVGGLVSVWDRTGRLVGLDLAARRIVTLATLRA